MLVLLSFHIPILVAGVVGNFFTVAGTVAVTTLVLSGCGNCGKCANCGCGAAFQYSVVVAVVVTGLVVTSSLLFSNQVFFCARAPQANIQTKQTNLNYTFSAICFFKWFANKCKMSTVIWSCGRFSRLFSSISVESHTSRSARQIPLDQYFHFVYFYSDDMCLAKESQVCVRAWARICSSFNLLYWYGMGV